MGKRFRKAKRKLDQRQADYDRLTDHRGRKRPGSMNMHKQVSSEEKKRRK